MELERSGPRTTPHVPKPVLNGAIVDEQNHGLSKLRGHVVATTPEFEALFNGVDFKHAVNDENKKLWVKLNEKERLYETKNQRLRTSKVGLSSE